MKWSLKKAMIKADKVYQDRPYQLPPPIYLMITAFWHRGYDMIEVYKKLEHFQNTVPKYQTFLHLDKNEKKQLYDRMIFQLHHCLKLLKRLGK